MPPSLPSSITAIAQAIGSGLRVARRRAGWIAVGCVAAGLLALAVYLASRSGMPHVLAVDDARLKEWARAESQRPDTPGTEPRNAHATAPSPPPATATSPGDAKAPETPEQEAARRKKEAQEAARRKQEAERLYREGFALQQRYRTRKALETYQKALDLDPDHARAQYEIGWSYWILERWPEVVKHWEKAMAAKVDVPELATYLEMARERMTRKPAPLVHPALHTRAGGGGVTLELVARFQHYNGEPTDPADHFDAHVFSPKSVQISPDGARAYVQALEGEATIVYDTRTLTKLRAIVHRFGPEDAGLFDLLGQARVAARFHEAGAPEAFDEYQGKPVEGVFSHGGRYLWVSHYRRNFDKLGILPSSVALIDTRTERIVRVLQAGPIPKFLAVSPDGHWLAVVHWGDNTVGLVDIRGDDPAAFRWSGEIVVGRRLPLALDHKVDRDHFCGFCLRGAVFTRDSRHLLVARMGGGGIAVLDVAARRHVGTVRGMKPTPRHLVLSPDGATLYVGSNASGYVSAYDTAALVAAARAGTPRLAPLREARTGVGTRTIAVSPDGALVYAAVNRESRLKVLDAQTFKLLAQIATDSFPVGLAVTPDGSHVWVTAQGVKLRGGNAVTVYRVTRGPPAATAPAPPETPPQSQERP